ncbi:hypothetical protein Aph01nite_76780 [Acrocarpospora phusangensis]|uniref:Transglycosylase SLT domain-containing protein n=1 Tax=Acrocarpospora phusangensis TaxID=1070424 RepID=A0A919QKI5_9ACTN|nr:hypothetical protein [Acrocarpospora phusangensis]GIH29368.1 hypothetical protein Aph01nite_76780 [Acrocarpospora phusangensis]
MPTNNPSASWLTPAQVAGFAVGAGFSGTALRIAVAVSFAENPAHDPASVGDATLTDAKWGPSIGLWQIRSLKADAGTGKERDARALDNPAFNAKSAYTISGGGKTWTAWTEFNNGGYRAKLAEADAAIKANGGKSGGVVGDPDVPKEEADMGLPAAILAAINNFGQGLFRMGLNAGALIVALVLITLGVAVLMREPIRRGAAHTARVAGAIVPGGKAASAAGKVAKL